MWKFHVTLQPDSEPELRTKSRPADLRVNCNLSTVKWNDLEIKGSYEGAGWAGYSPRIGTCDRPSASVKAALALPGLLLASGPRAG